MRKLSKYQMAPARFSAKRTILKNVFVMRMI